MLPRERKTLKAENPIRVVVVDDHKLFADTLMLLLERDSRVAIVGSAADASAGIDLAVEHEADVVVMDVSMPGIDGLEATRRLRELRPQTGVVILSGTADYAEEARAAGAKAFLTKGRIHDEVVDAVVSAARHDADDLAGRDSLPG